MLVLSRKLGESIEIGDNKVIVRVLGIKRSKVQLGVEAPPEVAIHRRENADQLGGQEAERSPRVSRGSSAALGRDRNGHDRDGLDQNVTDRNGRFSAFGESILDDLARVQAEIAALAELVSERDRLVARQVAAEAVERLTAIERTVRFAQRKGFEKPIAAFVGSRSRALQQLHQVDREDADANSSSDAPALNDSRDDSATLLRESNSPYRVGNFPCIFASCVANE